MTIVKSFELQDVLYVRISLQQAIDDVEKNYKDAITPNEDGKIDIKDVIEIYTTFYGFAYDEKTQVSQDITEDVYTHKTIEELIATIDLI
jgi:hypothetical protein